MDKVVYLAMVGASQATTKQAIHANNLANASTTGFKHDLAYFTTSPVEGPGYQARVSSLVQDPFADMQSGAVITTGRELDVALSDDGFIAVRVGDEGEAFTRNGELAISPDGALVTANNRPVLGEGGPIAIPAAERIMIANDGTISIKPLGAQEETMVVLERIKLVNPDKNNLEKRTDGLFYTRDNTILPAANDIALVPNAKEGSNVNLIGELVAMIENARSYETQVKLMKTAEDNDQFAARVMAER